MELFGIADLFFTLTAALGVKAVEFCSETTMEDMVQSEERHPVLNLLVFLTVGGPTP